MKMNRRGFVAVVAAGLSAAAPATGAAGFRSLEHPTARIAAIIDRRRGSRFALIVMTDMEGLQAWCSVSQAVLPNVNGGFCSRATGGDDLRQHEHMVAVGGTGRGTAVEPGGRVGEHGGAMCRAVQVEA